MTKQPIKHNQLVFAMAERAKDLADESVRNLRFWAGTEEKKSRGELIQEILVQEFIKDEA